MAQRPRQARIQFQSQFRSPGVDTSGAEVMRQLAGLGRTVGQIAETVGRPMVEQEMAEMGAKAAQEARVEDSETGLVKYQDVARKTYGWGSSAYNAAAAQETDRLNRAIEKEAKYSARIDSREKIAELAETYKDDPAGFESEVESYIQGTLKATPENAKLEVEDMIRTQSFATGTKLAKDYTVKQTNKKIDGIVSTVDDFMEEAARNLSGGKPVNAQIAYDSALEAIDDIGKLNPDYDVKGAKEKLGMQFASSQASASVMDAIDGNDTGPAYAKLEEIAKKPPKGFTPDEWERTVISKIQTDLNRKTTRLNNANQAAAAKNAEYVKGVVDSVSLGIEVDDAEFAKAYDLAATPAQVEALQDAEKVAEYSVSDYRTRQSVLTSAADNPETIDLYRQMAAQEKRINTSLNKDAFGFAASQGIVQNPVQLDVLNPDPEAIAERKSQAALATVHYGRQVPILTDAEANLLVKAFPEMTSEEQTAMAQAYGADSYIWGMLSDKNAGVYSQAASHPNPNVTQQVFIGLEKMKAPGYKIGEADTKTLTAAFNDLYGKDAFPAQDATDIFNAAMAYYTASKEPGKVASISDFKKALQDITGQVVSINGGKTILPFDVNEDDFEAYFDGMTAEELQIISPMDRTQQQIDNTLDFIRNGRYKQVKGDNAYIVVDKSGMTSIFNADGTPMTFIVNTDSVANIVSEEQRRRSAARQRMVDASIPTVIPFSGVAGQYSVGTFEGLEK